jgi:hypothetical protein
VAYSAHRVSPHINLGHRRTPVRGENDTVAFANGTGRFQGLHGIAAFSERSAGARLVGTLTGTLSP